MLRILGLRNLCLTFVFMGVFISSRHSYIEVVDLFKKMYTLMHTCSVNQNNICKCKLINYYIFV